MPSGIARPGFPRAVSCLSAIVFAGCIHVGALSHSALDYNKAVEEAQNRMLLLNIVRAELFRPMYITDLTKFSGSIKLDINSGGIETDYGPYINTLTKGTGSLTSGKLTPSFDYTQNPTFDVNVLAQQDFMKGFTSPCTTDLLAYYWEQGWPQEFLLYLFVHDVDDVDEKNQKVHYENYPDPRDPDLRKLQRFGQWVTSYVNSRPRFVRSEVRIGPCLEAGALDKAPNTLVDAAKEGLSVVKLKNAKGNSCWQLEQKKPDLILMKGNEATQYEGERRDCESSDPCDPLHAGAERRRIFHLSLRSPEGMLFYLGELMYAERNFGKIPLVCIGTQAWPLFVALEKSDDKNESICQTAVAVSYAGKEFIVPDREQKYKDIPTSALCSSLGVDIREATGIPLPSEQEAKRLPSNWIDEKDLNCFGGMSTESLTLLNQLIALQKSAKDVPTTSLVRAIVQ